MILSGWTTAYAVPKYAKNINPFRINMNCAPLWVQNTARATVMLAQTHGIIEETDDSIQYVLITRTKEGSIRHAIIIGVFVPENTKEPATFWLEAVGRDRRDSQGNVRLEKIFSVRKGGCAGEVKV